MKLFHVYEDWTVEELPRCFYVGKGDDQRVLKLKRSCRHTDIVKMFGQERRIVLTSADEMKIFEAERQHIILRHTHPNDPEYNGIGCNMTSGGQGNSGRIILPETKAKISAAKKGKRPNKIWSNAEREAMSIRMSALHKNKKISDQHRTILKKRMENADIKNEMIAKVTKAIHEKYENVEFKTHVLNTRARGISAKKSSLTEEQVVRMRLEWIELDTSLRGSKRKFAQHWSKIAQISTVAVNAIVTYKTWKHVTPIVDLLESEIPVSASPKTGYIEAFGSI